jgi:Zn-dependent peptidase ImmA (M78 family)/DNA-binding XRE family transcriptional regulator
MTDAKALGEALRQARDRRGLSQQVAADELDLARSAVSNIESGVRAVSARELRKLAELYGVDVADLLSADERTSDPIVMLPRRLPGVVSNADVWSSIEQFVACFKEGAYLRKVLGVGSEDLVPSYPPRRSSIGEALRQAEAVAKEERRRLGLGIAPVANMAEVLSSQGIWVAGVSFDDSHSGLFLNHQATFGMAVLINSGHAWVRRRFSYAHEYAHALLDRDEALKVTRSENASELAEKAANAFAAAFLMPAEGISEHLRRSNKGEPSRQTLAMFDATTDGMSEAEVRPTAGSQSITYQDVAAIARHYGVSYEAAVWRLRSLSRLTNPEASVLLDRASAAKKYIAALGGSPGDDDKYEPFRETRSQIIRLASEALRRGDITRARLKQISEMLRMPHADLFEFADAAASDDPTGASRPR